MSLKDLIKEVHSTDELIPLISQVVRERYLRKPSRDDGWHPSSFAGLCPRLAVLDHLLGSSKSKSVDPKMERIFDVGTAMHAWYQNEYLAQTGTLWGKWECSSCYAIQFGTTPSKCSNPLCADERAVRVYREVPVKAKLEGVSKPLVGHSDGLLNIKGKWYVFEIKTMNTYHHGPLAAPYDKHILQAQIYAELMRQGKVVSHPSYVANPIPVGIIFLYINKNDSSEKEFFIELDGNSARTELSKPRIIEQAIEDHILPDRQVECFSMLQPPAKKCPRCSHCYGRQSFDEIALFRK
jgi:hypothetical protein